MTDTEANRLIDEWRNPVKPFGELKSSEVNEAIEGYTFHFSLDKSNSNSYVFRMEDIPPMSKCEIKKPWYKRLIKRLKR